jgi:hypothetical protein
MGIVYDRAITAARGTTSEHRPLRHEAGVECRVGCGQWPCQPFLLALAVITRNSNTQALR